MEYNRDLNGKLHILSKPCVDTGMGLERIAAIMQGVHNNYHIGLFQHLLKVLGKLVGKDDFHDASMCVIVDHIRSVAFLISDGIVPSNEGRGYVLRRIIRRAIRHGYKLGQREPFFYELIGPLVEVMGDAYPIFFKTQSLIEQIIEQEEIQFSKTLSKGLKILDHRLSELSSREIPGEVIFQLYDTFGFPPDLTADIAREKGFAMDYAGFDKSMAHQREQSQQAYKFTIDYIQTVYIGGETEFVGYETFESEAYVITLLQDNKLVSTLSESKRGMVILDRTPFYAESGGQIGDQGYLFFEGGCFRVKDTKKQGTVYLHLGEVIKGKLRVKQKVHAKVDISRLDVMRNHSATHLLHEALRRILGEHVIQKGSLVEAKRLRFDFSHSKAMTKQELYAVERLINQQIQANLVASIKVMTLEKAKEAGALALFGERYGGAVRVLKLGDFSIEICEGTHIKRTGEIGLFKVISESSCASGIRRIEAVTGQAALAYIESIEKQLQILSDLFKTNRNDLIKRLNKLLEDHNKRQKELIKLRQQIIQQKLESLLKNVVDIRGIKVLSAQLDEVDRSTLRSIVDQLKQKLERAAIVLAIGEGECVQLAAGVTKNCLVYFDATELLAPIAEKIGGRSGGLPDMAQGGGSNSPERLKEAFQSIPKWIETRIG